MVDGGLPVISVMLVQGMRLLFFLNTAERRRGMTEHLEAALVEIVTLTISKVYARFKFEARACDLRALDGPAAL